MATTADELREEVRRRYAESARAVTEASEGCGCGSGSCCAEGETAEAGFGEALYDAEQRGELPEAAVLASLGCGNPTAVADLHEGETVLDLGSGGGIDVILSAKRVGPTGTAYGLDMTDEMLALAQHNAAEAGITNVHFLKGVIEQIPLPANSVDVVISNCVINLSTDKAAVLTEIARVLRPGGRVGVSDIVAEDHLTPDDRAERGSYVGCIAGALSEERVRRRPRSGRLRARLGRVHPRGRRRYAQRDRQGPKDRAARSEGAADHPACREGRLLLMAIETAAITIAELQPEHWTRVVAHLRRRDRDRRCDLRDRAAELGRLGLVPSAEHRFVALRDGEVVGWVAVSPVSDRCVYGGVVENSVYVDDDVRGQGVGRLLLERLIASTEAAGIWTIQSGIFPENEASLRLHQRVGFEIVGRRKRLGKLNGVWRDVLLLERRSSVVD